MAGQEISHGPGKTAPRLITDLLDYDPRRRNDGRNLLVDPAPRFRDRQLPPRTGVNDCRHTLMRKDTQTISPISNDEQPDMSTKYIVASYCSKCLYHFHITVDFIRRRGRQSPCAFGGPNLMHHLRLVESVDPEKYKERYGRDKYNTLTEAHRFVCSVEVCPVVVEINISPPRFGKDLLSLISDPAKVNRRGQKVIREDPERYEEMLPMLPTEIMSVLRQYLNDALTKAPNELKRIAKRNKKFLLAFSDECDSLFEYLDFTTVRQDGPTPDVSVSNLNSCQFHAQSLWYSRS